MDRNYHAEHALTIARHPSETDERMMARLLAFALNAHEHLKFGGGAPALAFAVASVYALFSAQATLTGGDHG
jgi:hypothetical protein